MTKWEAAMAVLAQHPEKRQEEILEAALVEACRRRPEAAAEYGAILEILRADTPDHPKLSL
jgi:hypothetical protein